MIYIPLNHIIIVSVFICKPASPVLKVTKRIFIFNYLINTKD